MYLYTPSLTNFSRTFIYSLVTTTFTPDYGSGPQTTNIIIIPVLYDFFLPDNSSITTMGACTLPPANSGLQGSALNPTNHCLVIYETTQNNGIGYCVARDGTGALDLPLPSPVMLFHELSHASRDAQNLTFSTVGPCVPCSPEESAAISDENGLRAELAARSKVTPELRDTSNHCGGNCPPNVVIDDGDGPCLIVSLASGSSRSREVRALRDIRDRILRRTEIGFAFFDELHYDYYGFSPQACSIMSDDAEIAPLVLEGYVVPFLTMLRTLKAYAFDDCDDSALGHLFLAAVGETDQRERSIDITSRIIEYWTGAHHFEDSAVGHLARLIREKAWPSEYLRWGLFDPIDIYLEILRLAQGHSDPSYVGSALRNSIDRWAPSTPVHDVWRGLAPSRLAEELEWLERHFFKSNQSRAVFRGRLLNAHGDLRQIRDLCVKAREAPDE
jgi:hypothetical protein